ncbi:MAG: hypothetical protein EWM72_01101 [Nitrospira sp.]|nr:MAG: hypothetical protein EWM72_01101 [Nitrospira sp.]
MKQWSLNARSEGRPDHSLGRSPDGEMVDFDSTRVASLFLSNPLSDSIGARGPVDYE